jgi:hypothetical protein
MNNEQLLIVTTALSYILVDAMTISDKNLSKGTKEALDRIMENTQTALESISIKA